LKKVFHRFSNANIRAAEAYREFIAYKGKQGHWALGETADDMKTLSPSEFWRTCCAFSPELQYAATWILEQACSNSAAERDWKDYKLTSTKARSCLAVDKVRKLIKCHNGIKIEQADEAAWRREHKKFTEVDEMCKLDAVLVAAAAIVPLRFKNYIELDTEFPAIKTKCDASERLLLPKYNFIFFTDPDVEGEVELRRIVGIEWKVMRPARDSQYNVVTQLVERNGVAAEDDDGFIAYLINEELHAMIRGAGVRNNNHVLEPMPEAVDFDNANAYFFNFPHSTPIARPPSTPLGPIGVPHYD
jgi:hypothetical protein